MNDQERPTTDEVTAGHAHENAHENAHGNAKTIPTPPPDHPVNGVKLDMNLEDMFPETPLAPGEKSSVPLGAGTGMKDPTDRRPPWLYRITGELTTGEVRLLFMQSAGKFARRLSEHLGELRVHALYPSHEDGAVRPKAPLPNFATSRKHADSRGKLNKLASRIVAQMESALIARLDLIPRAEMDMAVYRAEERARDAISQTRCTARLRLIEELELKLAELLADDVVHARSLAREGRDDRGQRVVAVWTGAEPPGEDEQPEF